MAKITWAGTACPDCTIIIANDDDSGIPDAAAHRARMAQVDAGRHGYLVIGDAIDTDDETCSVCGGKILPSMVLGWSTNAHTVVALD